MTVLKLRHKSSTQVILCLVFILMKIPQAHSQSFGVLGGLGMWSQSNIGGRNEGESPGAVKAVLDLPLSGYSAFTVEYMRSIGIPFSSGIGIAQISVRYYPFFRMPIIGGSLVGSPISYSDGGYSMWVSPAIGFASGSTSEHTNLGVSFNPTIGVDYSWGSRFFLRTEASYLLFFGQGKIYGMTGLIGGLYYF